MPRTIALLLTVIAALATAAPAAAQTLRGPVTDEAGVLSAAEEAAVERDLDAARRRGVDLHVLFVDGTGGRSATAYAADVAAGSSMGGDDALLVVAFGERTFALWTADPLRVSGGEIQAILDRGVAPRLRANDLPGAVAAAAAGVAQARGASTGGQRGTRSTGSGFPLLLLLLFGAGAIFLFTRMARRLTGGGGEVAYEPARPPVDLATLSAQANAALVRIDDKLQDAEHESGFAEAQYGKEESASLRAGLDQARAELRAAFNLRQQLDDHVPEPPAEQARLLQRIVGHAEAAEAIVDERLQRLEELRGLERDPQAAAEELRARIDRLGQRIGEAEVRAGELHTAAPEAAVAVDGNVAEAGKRAAFAQERLAEATAAATPAEAAQAIRAGGAALAQAEQLLDAVEDLADRVRQARQVLPQELQEAELALARAEDLIRSRRHIVGREARTRLAEAQRRFDRARTLSERDPAGATAEADAAERLAAEAFDLAWSDSEAADRDDGFGGGGGIRGAGWGLPLPIPFPIPIGGGIGWGGSSWGGGGFGGFGGSVGGGSFGGGSVGGGRW